MITLVDIGAAGGLSERWKPVSHLVDYVGFEPDERSPVPEHGCKSFTLHRHAVWNEPQVTINLCRREECSSPLRPNMALLTALPNPERWEIVGGVTVPARPLDDFTADFVKIDIQGGELAALQSGDAMLADCLGVEAEVEFREVYEGQPLFGDVSAYLASKGLVFIDFLRLVRWGDKSQTGACYFGDALFLRLPENVPAEKMEAYRHICRIYNKGDLIGEASGKDNLKARLTDRFARFFGRKAYLHP